MENYIEFIRNIYNVTSSETLQKIIEDSEYIKYGLYHVCDLFNILFEASERRQYLAEIYWKVFKTIVDRFRIEFIQGFDMNNTFEPLLDLSDGTPKAFIQYSIKAKLLMKYLKTGHFKIWNNKFEEIVFRDDLEGFLKYAANNPTELHLIKAIEYNAEKILDYLVKNTQLCSSINCLSVSLRNGNMRLIKISSERFERSALMNFDLEDCACESRSIEVVKLFQENVSDINIDELYHLGYLEPFVKMPLTFDPLAIALNTCSTEVFKEMIEEMSKEDIEILAKIMFSRYESDDGLIISRWSNCYLSAYMNEYIRKYLEKHFKEVVERCR